MITTPLTTDTHPPSPTTTVPVTTSISPPETVTSPTPALPAPSSVEQSDCLSPGLPLLLGRGHRSHKPSVLLKDYVVNATQLQEPPLASSSSVPGSSITVSGTTPYPISTYLSRANFSAGHKAFVAALTSNVEPRNYKEACFDDEWNDSMTDEYAALEGQHTWDVTSLPPGKKAIACQWIYKNKYLSNGKIFRRKSRVVACGNRQREGLDYTDTFAPVAKKTTVRILLQISAARKWEIHQMDVHNAFLNGDLQEEVYMKFPPGFEHPDPTKVCRLRKSIYGLKQSPRCWFAKLRTALKDYGFKQSRADYSHFSLIKGNISLHILIYVDDFIVAGNDISTIQKFKNYLSKCFHMKDMGKLKYFLGIEVARNSEGIFLSQRKYALDIVSETGLLGSKPCSTPIELNHKLALAVSHNFADLEAYRRLIGRLIYLTFT